MPLNDLSTILLTSTCFAAGAVVGYMMSKRKYTALSNEYFAVGKITSLYIYPIKSCRGVAVTEAEFTKLGLKQSKYLRDRVFMVVESNGHFITARQETKMILIQPDIKDDTLTLSAPEKIPVSISMPEVEKANELIECRVWGQDSLALDCGNEIGEWLSTYLCHPGIRLVYYPWNRITRPPKIDSHWPLFKQADSTIFGDLTQCHIVNEASVKDLNSRLPEDIHVTFKNFRPNIVINGKRPYEEDNWKQVKIGSDVQCRIIRPCTRCVLTTINTETGIFNKGKEPLSTLKLYRQITHPKIRQKEGDSPMFGQYLGLDKGGVIKVDDLIVASF